MLNPIGAYYFIMFCKRFWCEVIFKWFVRFLPSEQESNMVLIRFLLASPGRNLRIHLTLTSHQMLYIPIELYFSIKIVMHIIFVNWLFVYHEVKYYYHSCIREVHKFLKYKIMPIWFWYCGYLDICGYTFNDDLRINLTLVDHTSKTYAERFKIIWSTFLIDLDFGSPGWRTLQKRLYNPIELYFSKICSAYDFGILVIYVSSTIIIHTQVKFIYS
jgi:hypothetical protein